MCTVNERNVLSTAGTTTNVLRQRLKPTMRTATPGKFVAECRDALLLEKRRTVT